MIRPALRAAILRHRESLAGVAVLLAGLWLATRGGPVLATLGGAVALGGAAWAVQALRRARFAPGQGAPGMVEVDEGQVGYLGPAFGGFVALPDLVELRLMAVGGRRMWRLRQVDGQALLIPVDAVGGERLYDAFASLPGMDTAALVAALAPAADDAPDGVRVIWRRPAVLGDTGVPRRPA